jgi:hypothetical protein
LLCERWGEKFVYNDKCSLKNYLLWIIEDIGTIWTCLFWSCPFYSLPICHFWWENKVRFITHEHQICKIFNSSLYNMAKKIRKLRKDRVDKGLFGCRFVTTKAKQTNENKGCLQNGNVLASLLQSTNIGFIRENPNTTNLGHFRNHCFNPSPNCIKLCVKLSTLWLLVAKWCTYKCN